VAAGLSKLVVGELPWPLFVYGGAGRGKSSLGLALADHVRKSLYITVSDFVDQLAGYNHQKAETWEQFNWTKYAEPPLVVIDELGTRSLTEVQYDSLLRLIDRRETHPLVLISNFDIPHLITLYDQRLASRLDAGTVIEWIGPDLRTV
jgi:DNA replication protein DnaC